MNNIKLLLITNKLYPELSANSDIAYKISYYLKKEKNCDISLLGYSLETQSCQNKNKEFRNEVREALKKAK